MKNPLHLLKSYFSGQNLAPKKNIGVGQLFEFLITNEIINHLILKFPKSNNNLLG